MIAGIRIVHEPAHSAFFVYCDLPGCPMRDGGPNRPVGMLRTRDRADAFAVEHIRRDHGGAE